MKTLHHSSIGFAMLSLILLCTPSVKLEAQITFDTPPKIYYNQQFVEGINNTISVDSVEAIFDLVYNQLPDSVYVFPTENYYYFRTFIDGKWIWGNIRLSVHERDLGILNFAYYPYVDDPKHPDESPTYLKSWSSKDGLILNKRRPFCYEVDFKGKKVIFQLNELPQTPPKDFDLQPGEVFVQQTFDESGFPYFLIFNSINKHFMFVLNEEIKPLNNAIELGNQILLDKLSGFAFFEDTIAQNRKILMGVFAQNIRRNNYWDGPFDQLADNYKNPYLKVFLEEAYPYAKGGLDEYGFFKIIESTRLALNPYYEYESIEELLNNFNYCKNEIPQKEFYTCLCYDQKTSYLPVEGHEE